MPMNLAIDEKLLEEAKQIGGHRTENEAVTAALEEYIRHRKRLEILDSFGTIDYYDDYDIKALRKKESR